MRPEAITRAATDKMITLRTMGLALGMGLAAMASHPSGTTAADSVGAIAIVGEIGGPPADFRPDRTGKGAAGEWTIVSDATAEGGRALAQMSPDQTDYRFPLAIYQPVIASDVDVSVRFKAVAGRVDRAGGIAVRILDADNYYVARANALEDNVNFYRVVRGVRQQIRGTRAKVTSEMWHTIGLRAIGDKFTVMFDGRILFTVSDAAFAGPGKVGLWTKADSITRFDSLKIHVRQ